MEKLVSNCCRADIRFLRRVTVEFGRGKDIYTCLKCGQDCEAIFPIGLDNNEKKRQK